MIIGHEVLPRKSLLCSWGELKSVAVTTLAIHDLSTKSTLIDSFCDGAKYSFLNLRVLRLEGTRIPVPRVYDFIRRHSTLREVAVSFEPWDHRSLRLEPLIKLIQGTGNWVYSKHEPYLVLDQPSFDEYAVGCPIPPDFDYNWGAFYEFAFSRVALPGGESTDPQKPRYKCTRLAIQFLDKDDDIEHLTAQLPPDVSVFLEPGETPECLRDVQELRLSFAIEQDTLFPFDGIMLVSSLYVFVITAKLRLRRVRSQNRWRIGQTYGSWRYIGRSTAPTGNASTLTIAGTARIMSFASYAIAWRFLSSTG